MPLLSSEAWTDALIHPRLLVTGKPQASSGCQDRAGRCLQILELVLFYRKALPGSLV